MTNPADLPELATLVKTWADEIERLLPPATPTYNVVHEMRIFVAAINGTVVNDNNKSYPPMVPEEV